MYDDMNRPLGSDPMRTQESSPWGGLIALAAVGFCPAVRRHLFFLTTIGHSHGTEQS